MEKPRLQDFDLTEESKEYLSKFEQSIASKEGWAITVSFCVFWGTMGLIANNSQTEINNMGILILILLLFIFPWFITDWLGKDKNKYILASPNEYRLYEKTKANLNAYEEKLAEYNVYKRRIDIETRLREVVILQNSIFNKKITSDNLDTLKKIEAILEQLKNYDNGMTREEKDNCRFFQNYINQRKRSYQKNGTYSEKKKNAKAKEKNFFDGNNTAKITIIETNNEDEINEGEDAPERSFEGKIIDFDVINKENVALGKKGELAIINYEKELLIRNDRSDLAEKVEHIAENKGAGTGYDILSFDLDGNPKYIEVKTTKRGKKVPFMLSVNELAFIEHEPSYCYIYRLYDFDEENQAGKLIIANGYAEIMNKFNIKSSQYRVSIK